MNTLAIIGAGGFGREVQDLVRQINLVSPRWDLVGFYDDGLPEGTVVNGVPVLGSIADLNSSSEVLYLALAVGNPETKKKIVHQLTSAKIKYATLIHPLAITGDPHWNRIGEGSIICAGVIMTVQIQVGKHVILNLSCTVGHDSVIGDYSSFMPTVNISGEVSVGEGVFVGTGVKIINQVTIGENSTIGAGAVVTSNIPANCTAVGVPAKPIKFRQ
jgi:sugar O-acyltransferase (sialic acid O-acetyltransferase NeuD family)